MHQCNELRIQIDCEAYKSPQATTHKALYALGKVQEDKQLFAKSSDKSRYDEPIKKDDSRIHLIEGQQFYSCEVSFLICVNGRKKTVQTAILSYEEILKLAFDPVPTGENICFTVTYTRGRGKCKEGQLAPGECVAISERMNFNVTKTDKS